MLEPMNRETKSEKVPAPPTHLQTPPPFVSTHSDLRTIRDLLNHDLMDHNHGTLVILSLSDKDRRRTSTNRSPNLNQTSSPCPLSAIQYFEHRPRKLRQILFTNDQRRREINNVAKRFDPASLFHKLRPQPCCIHRLIHLHHADRAFHAHIAHVRQSPTGRKLLFQLRLNNSCLMQPRLPLKQVQRSIRRCASQRIPHICWPVHQRRLSIIRQKRLVHTRRSHGRSQRHRSARQCLRQTNDIRCNSRLLAREHRPSPHKPRKNLIKNQQQSMPVAQCPQLHKNFRVMKLHSTRCLDQRLNDHRRNFAAILRQELVQFAALLGRIRHLAYKLFRHHAAKDLVHPLFWVANRHRRKRIAVISAAEAYKLRPPLASIQPKLHPHFHRLFHSHRS